jgi:hypothetical protein
MPPGEAQTKRVRRRRTELFIDPEIERLIPPLGDEERPRRWGDWTWPTTSSRRRAGTSPGCRPTCGLHRTRRPTSGGSSGT